MKKIKNIAGAIILLVFACNQPVKNGEENPQNTSVEKLTLLSPEFDADSAYFFTNQQVSFGPRIPGTSAHEKCGNYLVEKLKSYGMVVEVQNAPVKTHDGKSYTLKNIIASLSPDKKERILVSAHWDARPISDQDPLVQAPFDAANDGGSGVAVIIELARLFQKKNPNVGVDLALWDLEDYGKTNDAALDEPTWCLGSQYWYKHPHQKNYKARFGINLDMVGGVNAAFTQEANSTNMAGNVVEKIWGVAHEIGFGDYFLYVASGNIVDDHLWMNKAGVPSVDIIHFSNHTGFYEHWHTQNDNMKYIDKNSLKAVGQTVAEVIYREK